jgi:uncharacterized membrane protein YdbT with pleckstrin-like domain
MHEEEEQIIWEGHPSHIKDLGFHLLCLLLAPLVIPLGLSVRRCLDTHFRRYGITSERLQVTTGILSKHMHELELYRVQETSIHQPFFLRLFRLANLEVTLGEPDKPPIVIRAVPEARELRERLRACVETMRDRKHVHEAA